MKNDEYLTPAEVAAELRVNVRTVYGLLRRNELPHFNLGHRTKRITREALDNYKNSKVVRPCS